MWALSVARYILRSRLVVLGILASCITLFIFLLKSDGHYIGVGRSCRPIKGLEKERSRFTLVTALTDIGRGDWGTYTRMYQDYLQFSTLILQYDVNVIVYIEKKGVDFVTSFRAGCASRTKVIQFDYNDYPLSNLERNISRVISSDSWRENNELLKNAEAFPRYNVIMNSKPYLLYNASVMNPFNTDYFYWIDFGWGHGELDHFPDPDVVWAPIHLFQPEVRNKITMLQVGDTEIYRNKMDRFYKLQLRPAFAGGFLGGRSDVITTFYHLHMDTYLKLLEKNVTDDDQGVYLVMFNEHPELFYHPFGDYFDVFSMFKTRQLNTGFLVKLKNRFWK